MPDSVPAPADASHTITPEWQTTVPLLTANPNQGRHLVLLGAGHAHVQLLAEWARRPLPDTRVTLVAPYPRQMYSGMVPGFIAGRYNVDDCVIPLEPLIAACGVRWIPLRAMALDADRREIQLVDGSRLSYDWLSVNTGPVQDPQVLEQQIPGIRSHGLFVRPIEAFTTLWPRVVALSEQRDLRIAVMGGGAAGLELAMAIRHRLPRAAITIVSATAVGSIYPESVQQRLQRALRKRRIDVILDAVVAVGDDEIQLKSGARLACDVPLVALAAQAPAWLRGSGLALDAQGFIAVDVFQRSTSHPQVFAAGDVCTRIDRNLPRSGVIAVRAGPALIVNLAAALGGMPLKAHQPPAHTLNILACGDHHAIASWGQWSAEGRWVSAWKHWVDRRFMTRYQRPPASA